MPKHKTSSFKTLSNVASLRNPNTWDMQTMTKTGTCSRLEARQICERVATVRDAVQMALPLFKPFVGVDVDARLRWSTGAKEHILASKVVATEYILGKHKANSKDVFPSPITPMLRTRISQRALHCIISFLEMILRGNHPSPRPYSARSLRNSSTWPRLTRSPRRPVPRSGTQKSLLEGALGQRPCSYPTQQKAQAKC